ncbi:MAG: hypothetical protein WCO44_03410 [Bacteroidota bacterium]
MKIFDFQDYMEELRNDPIKSCIIERYEKFVEPLHGKEITELLFYKEYYSKIKVLPYKIPDLLEDSFDWDLLAKLVIGSFSSVYNYETGSDSADLPELVIYVSSGDTKVSKTVSELWSFQIDKLFKIYTEEAANLQALKEEDDTEKTSIEMERLFRLKAWNKIYGKAVLTLFNPIGSAIKSELEKYIES